MRTLLNLIILLFFIVIGGCNGNKLTNNEIGQNETFKNTFKQLNRHQIWQLDYYPDSILINRSIYDNSGWISDFAYNIQFSADSCQLIGWHESKWNKVKPISENNYKIPYSDVLFLEIKFDSEEKLYMRPVYCVYDSKTNADTGKFCPYHPVSKILAADSLNKMIAKNLFAGTYKVLFHDTLSISKKVVLDDNFGVNGIAGIKNYCFETDIEWDISIYNAFGFSSKTDECAKGFSFVFSGDTLLLYGYQSLHNGFGDFCGTKINNPRIKMIKLK